MQQVAYSIKYENWQGEDIFILDKVEFFKHFEFWVLDGNFVSSIPS